jgi:hypothetical protein
VTWSVSITFSIQSIADQAVFADELERLFDALTEETAGPVPGVSGEIVGARARVNVDLDVEAEDEIGALQSAVNLVMEAFSSTGMTHVGVIHAELSRLSASTPASV